MVQDLTLGGICNAGPHRRFGQSNRNGAIVIVNNRRRRATRRFRPEGHEDQQQVDRRAPATSQHCEGRALKSPNPFALGDLFAIYLMRGGTGISAVCTNGLFRFGEQ